MKNELMAAINFGMPSPITQSWLLGGYPMNPYVVLRDYTSDDGLHEIRCDVDADKIQKNPIGPEGHYVYLGIIESETFQDILV